MANPLSSGFKLPTDAQRYAHKRPRLHPCPCGYFGDLKRECRCSPVQVQRYRQRISGPLLDRIDLHIEVPAVEYRDVSSDRTEENSTAIRERIARARQNSTSASRATQKQIAMRA
jgi:magnesium chelatase family protein